MGPAYRRARHRLRDGVAREAGMNMISPVTGFGGGSARAACPGTTYRSRHGRFARQVPGAGQNAADADVQASDFTRRRVATVGANGRCVQRWTTAPGCCLEIPLYDSLIASTATWRSRGDVTAGPIRPQGRRSSRPAATCISARDGSARCASLGLAGWKRSGTSAPAPGARKMGQPPQRPRRGRGIPQSDRQFMRRTRPRRSDREGCARKR